MNRLFANQWPLIPSQQIDSGQEFIGLADIAGFLRHYVVTIATCLAAALCVGWFYVSTTDPVFTAVTQILIEPKLPQHLQEGGEINLSLDTAQVESQIAVMESEKIASMVIDRLGLIDDLEFNRPATPVLRERFRKMREALSEAFGTQNIAWLSSILDKLGVGVPVPAEPLTAYQTARRGMSIFQKSLGIRRVGVSYAIDISFTSAVPEEAARIANATAEAFVYEQVETKAEAARQGGAWLEKRLQQLRTQMNAAMAKSQEFRSRHDYSLGGGQDAGDVTAEPTLEELEVTADTYKKMYESFLQAYTNSVSQQSYPVADARVITSATAPLLPSAPKTKLVLAFAGVAGLILGIAISFIRHSFDWTIRSPQQIRDSLAIECVGELPSIRRGREFGGLDEVARHPGSRYSRLLRKTRTEISLAETNHPVKILGITAVANSRQKSSIVSNLATLYSTAGLKTLVIDADVEKSLLTARLLGHTGPAGPSRQSIAHAPERPFDVLSSSAVEAWNLRDPKKMQAFLADLAASEIAGCELGAYDLVIVDMPTLVSGSDDLIVGSVLDGVIVVAEWGRTHVETLRELVRTLQAGRTQVLGVLLAGGRADTSKHRRAMPKHSSFGTHQSP